MRSASVLIKKVLACVVGLGMMGLAACGGGAGGSSTSNSSSSAKGGSSSSSSSASNGKAVVVYFSASGNTKRAAEASPRNLTLQRSSSPRSSHTPMMTLIGPIRIAASSENTRTNPCRTSSSPIRRCPIGIPTTPYTLAFRFGG